MRFWFFLREKEHKNANFVSTHGHNERNHFTWGIL